MVVCNMELTTWHRLAVIDKCVQKLRERKKLHN
jgi:hypothetical protein